MHPSRDIIGTKGGSLRGRRIALCVTGSVAAIRSPEIARELMRLGAEVRACMSDGARTLITPELMHWATANEVVTSLTGRIEHVELAEWADLVLVAPATANTISKIACAVDDTPVTSVVSVAMGLRKPVMVVPAMHASMYDHPILRENLERLRSAGVRVLEPVVEEGKAKLPDIGSIVEAVVRALGPRDMEGMKVVVTAGPTEEPIDSVRVITNRSSGKMGMELARAAAERGAEVVLVYGPGTEAPPPGVRAIRVRTTSEMREAVMENAPGTRLILGAAAPQDFTVRDPREGKIRRTESVTLDLAQAPRVMDDLRKVAPDAYIVAFKAEYGAADHELEDACREKLREGDYDMVVGNDLSRDGFGSPTSRVVIVTRRSLARASGTKREVAGVILDTALGEIRGS